MSVRKRVWHTPRQIKELAQERGLKIAAAAQVLRKALREGDPLIERYEPQQAWACDYSDGEGKRRHRTFETKGEANDFEAQTRIDLRKGTHVADSASVTVKQAAELWLEHCKNPIEDDEPLEASTLAQYRQHIDLHIVPFIGSVKVSRLTAPAVKQLQTQLRKAGRSAAMVRKVTRSLGTLLSDAQEHGKAAHNVVRELRRDDGRRKKRRGQQKRHNGKLKVGVHIPTPEEIRTLLATATGRWRPLLLTAALTGLRASELRGLVWDNVDLKKGELHVRQRADRFGKIGPPKSEAGERTLPLPPPVVAELRAWKLQCPNSELRLVFATRNGEIDSHRNIVRNGLIPTLIKAGITKPVLNEHGRPMHEEDGKPSVTAKYSGLHALRHFFASWCINRKVDGGCELPPKIVQTRMGHASITMTMDTYGHLFPSDDGTELAAAAQILLG